MWQDEVFGEFSGDEERVPTEGREVVAIGVSDAANEPMQAETFEDATDLRGGFGGEQVSQPTATEAVEDELPADEREEDSQVFGEEEVKAAPTAIALVVGWAANAVQVVSLRRVILQRTDELEIAPARRGHQPVEVGQAVDRLLEWSDLAFGAAIAVVHLAVVTEKRDIVGGRLDPQHSTAAIIHLQGLFTEVVADAGAFHASLKPRSRLRFGAEPLVPETRQIIDLDRQYRLSTDLFVNGMQVCSAAEHHIESILHLHDRPMVSLVKAGARRAEPPSEGREFLVQSGDGKLVADRLRARPVAQFDQGSIVEGDAHALRRDDSPANDGR